MTAARRPALDALELPPVPADPGADATDLERYLFDLEAEHWIHRARAIAAGEPDPGPIRQPTWASRLGP